VLVSETELLSFFSALTTLISNTEKLTPDVFGVDIKADIPVPAFA
jgi:hypothetical protein